MVDALGRDEHLFQAFNLPRAKEFLGRLSRIGSLTTFPSMHVGGKYAAIAFRHLEMMRRFDLHAASLPAVCGLEPTGDFGQFIGDECRRLRREKQQPRPWSRPNRERSKERDDFFGVHGPTHLLV